MPPLPSIISWPDLPTPLGQICFGGELRGAGGTGFDAHRRFGMYAFVLLCGGSGLYLDEAGGYEMLRTGDVIVVSPGLAHQYGPTPGNDWHELFICFRGEALADRLTSLALPPVLHLEEAACWRLRFEELLGQPPRSSADALSIVSLLHVLISDLAATVSQSDVPTWLASARELLQSTSRDRLDAAEVARHCGLTYSSFRRKFREAMGTSPGRYRQSHQLRRAALLMRNTPLPLAEVAERCGFCDAAHLSQRFRSAFGVAPSVWRSGDSEVP